MLLLVASLLSCSSGPVTVSEPAPKGWQAPAQPRKHAVVIVLDTLRNDAVLEADTPILDALGKEGSRVDRAWSAGTWTVPSVVSMMTGMSVRQHGWNLPTGNAKNYPMIPPAPMLAEVLKDSGFHTDGLYANDFLDGRIGFGRGFDSWKRTPDKVMAKRVGALVGTWKPEERHFLYVHMLATHSPLRPSGPARDKYQVDKKWTEARLGFLVGVCKRNRKEGARPAYRQAYHAVVEDVDARVGEVLDALGEHRKDSVIIVTSDHGELLGDHGICGHGHWAYEALTNVPFIAVGVGDLPSTISNASVPALVTAGLGVTHSWPTPPAQALPLVSTREEKMAMTLDGRHKGVWHKKGLELYDLQSDPGEEHPLDDPALFQQLTDARAEWEAKTPMGARNGDQVELAPETFEALKVLGYVDEP